MADWRAYRVAYDGRPYHGFQRQPTVPTVEDEIFSALRELDVIDEDGPPLGYAAAGRTDAGVSAVAQTVGFNAPGWLSPAAMNSELPDSIRVWASAPTSSDFHATHDATEREYTYFMDGRALAESRTRRAVEELSGQHDFHNLTPEDTGTRRTLEITLAIEWPFFVLTVCAGGFARQLVRRLVSLVREVGAGEAASGRIDTILTDESLSGPAGVAPAPAYPLVLTDVAYPSLSFRTNSEAASRALDRFEDLWIERSTSARVARELVDGIDAGEPDN